MDVMVDEDLSDSIPIAALYSNPTVKTLDEQIEEDDVPLAVMVNLSDIVNEFVLLEAQEETFLKSERDTTWILAELKNVKDEQKELHDQLFVINAQRSELIENDAELTANETLIKQKLVELAIIENNLTDKKRLFEQNSKKLNYIRDRFHILYSRVFSNQSSFPKCQLLSSKVENQKNASKRLLDAHEQLERSKILFSKVDHLVHRYLYPEESNNAFPADEYALNYLVADNFSEIAKVFQSVRELIPHDQLFKGIILAHKAAIPRVGHLEFTLTYIRDTLKKLKGLMFRIGEEISAAESDVALAETNLNAEKRLVLQRLVLKHDKDRAMNQQIGKRDDLPPPYYQ